LHSLEPPDLFIADNSILEQLFYFVKGQIRIVLDQFTKIRERRFTNSDPTRSNHPPSPLARGSKQATVNSNQSDFPPPGNCWRGA